MVAPCIQKIEILLETQRVEWFYFLTEINKARTEGSHLRISPYSTTAERLLCFSMLYFVAEFCFSMLAILNNSFTCITPIYFVTCSS
jgi:hypothetical protein